MDNTSGANSAGSGAPFYPSFQELPQCALCGKRESELQGSKLKRCTGCTVTFYCSRDCQKTAWPRHKCVLRFSNSPLSDTQPLSPDRQLCRHTDKESGIEIGPSHLAGYPALIALENAIVDWGEAHSFAFCIIASATAHLNGGVGFTLASARAIVLRALPRAQNAAGERTPANAFRLGGAPEIVRMSEFGSLADGWDGSRVECERIMENIHRERPDETYAGVLPAVVVVPGAGFASFRHFPVYRRVRDDSRPLGALERAVMQDVLQMCMGIVNGGFVMRASANSRRADPDVGTLVKKGKKWEWKVKEDWNWTQIGMGRPGETRTGAHPVDIWEKFYDL